MRYFGHATLLALARKARSAARDGDLDRLHLAAVRFLDELDHHLEEERRSLVALSPAQAQLICNGQQRVRSVASALAYVPVEQCREQPGRCSSQASELLALLSVQAQNERLAWQVAVEWGPVGDAAHGPADL